MSLSDTINKAAAAAFRAVGDLAFACTLSRKDVAGGTYDPETQDSTDSTETDTGECVWDNTPVQQRFEARGLEIEPSDRIAVLRGFSTLTPRTNDTITVDGAAYKLLYVDDVSGIGKIFVCPARPI